MTADEFREARQKLGFSTAYAFARAIGVTRQQAYKLESGERDVKPTLARLIRMYLRNGGVPDEFITL